MTYQVGIPSMPTCHNGLFLHWWRALPETFEFSFMFIGTLEGFSLTFYYFVINLYLTVARLYFNRGSNQSDNPKLVNKMLYLHFVQTTLYWNSIWYCFNSTGYKIGNGSGCKPRSIGGRLEMSTVLILPSDWLRFRKRSLFCTWIRDQLCVLPIVRRGLVCWGIGKNKGYLAFVKICGFAHVSERVQKER